MAVKSVVAAADKQMRQTADAMVNGVKIFSWTNRGNKTKSKKQKTQKKKELKNHEKAYTPINVHLCYMYSYVCMYICVCNNKKNNNGGLATTTVTICWQQKSVRATVRPSIHPSIHPLNRPVRKQTNQTVQQQNNGTGENCCATPAAAACWQ